MIKIGSHVSFKSPNYLVGAIQESLNNNATCAMIYLGPPQNTIRVSTDKYQYQEYLLKYQSLIPESNIVVHAPYIINAANPTKYKFAQQFLIQEIQRMNYINANLLVLHPGAHTEFSRKEALDTLIETLKYVISKTKDVIICLETMAGKGTEICSNLDEINYVITNVNSSRLGVCLDTCHIWDAGYNIRDYNNFKQELKEKNIFQHIKVIHLNDSLNPRSSHKDRHANIDKGYIGFETLEKFVYDPEFKEIPKILETPYINNQSPYKEEIAMLLHKNEVKLF
ncbi:putative endonuclease 4 [Metamycoplasma cloacale]|uniref:Probable endonuclease 4 n=1 Tax=Metamycoplasma cloacale TaxID=92401 RepID=A0A2Z4LM35_9BACT|nr:deoxyribonuclease IV [Metamycoplasma cloacale]AWX42799.1 deoxyribonuclease IV [Metamycoplasma cloacale]VEU79382.1 putative endonuclease 4 [Metamycoplasma cloacale]